MRTERFDFLGWARFYCCWCIASHRSFTLLLQAPVTFLRFVRFFQKHGYIPCSPASVENAFELLWSLYQAKSESDDHWVENEPSLQKYSENNLVHADEVASMDVSGSRR